jgi:hypothetical protein
MSGSRNFISIVFLSAMLISLCFYSCKKDLGKIASPDWNPNLAIPFIESEMTLNDAIEADSNLIINPDSSLKIVYYDDSIFSINIGEVFQFPEQEMHEESFSLGAISIGDLNLSLPTKFHDVLLYIDPVIVEFFMKYNGTNAIFPPLSLDTAISNDPLSLTGFKSLSFSGGRMELGFIHYLPITFDHVLIRVYSPKSPFLLGEFEFIDLTPGEEFVQFIDLAGKTITNEFVFEMSDLSTPGSYPDSVPINWDDKININLGLKDLKIASGEAFIIEQVIVAKQEMVDFDFDEGVEITKIALKTGRIDYTLVSGIPARIKVKLSLPSALQNGEHPFQSVLLEPNQSAGVYWELDATTFDLTSNPEKPYNSFPIEYTITLESSTDLVIFDSASKVSIEFMASDFEISMAEGYLGQQEVNIEPQTIDMDIDFLEHFSGGLELTDPEVKLFYHNSIGLPFQLNLNLLGENNEQQTENLHLDQVDILYPSTAGQEVYGEYIADKNNSNIVDFISISPRKISYSGYGIGNPEGFATNFISDASQFTADIAIDLPIRIQADDLIFVDTVQVNVNGDDFNGVESGQFHFVIDNGFPFDIKLDFLILDPSDTFVVESIALNTINSAQVNASGEVTKSVSSIASATFNEYTYDNLKNANHCVLKAQINTAGGGTMASTLYTNYKIKIKIGLQIIANL